MEFEIIKPCGGCFKISLKSKELKGKQLIHEVYQNIKVAEDTRDYFGICYTDRDDGGKNWVRPDDNLKSYNTLTAAGRVQLQFEVRIYPRDPDLIFPTADSRRIFRQHMKNLLVNNQIGCDNKTNAMLDAFIVQAEIGDYIDGDKSYFQKVNDIEIYAPTSLCSGTPLTETQYLKMMRMYHRKLTGMSAEQADILYLSLIQKIPLYGYSLYHVADSMHKEHFLALSPDGIHFIYESCLEKFLAPQMKETINWHDLVFCEVERKKIKLGYKVLQNSGEISEKTFKIKNKYTHRGASRFKADLNKHKDMFVSHDHCDGHGIFCTRKEAAACYTNQLQRRSTSLGGRLNSIRSSIKQGKGKARVVSAKEKRTPFNKENLQTNMEMSL